MSGGVLDTGALIGFERNDRRVVAIVARALHHDDTLTVPAGVVARAWRDGSRRARLSRLLRSPVCEVHVLDDYRGRAAGQLCGVAETDVVDAPPWPSPSGSCTPGWSRPTPTTSVAWTLASTWS